MSTKYDWEPMRDAARTLGGVFDESAVAGADQEFAAAGLTQRQAEAMFWAYAWRTMFYWNPSNWKYGHRLLIAALFLFHSQRILDLMARVKAFFGRP